MLATMMAFLLDDNARKSFGARLKTLRKARSLTQKEVAVQLGVQHTHYNKYEAGIYVPPMEKVVQLGAYFGVTLDYLILGVQPDDSTVHNTNLLERFKELDAAPRDIQETIVELIDAMIFKMRVQGAATHKPL